MRQYVPLRASIVQHCSLSAGQRETAFAEELWWPEFDMSGSMPWWSFPWHKHLPRLAQKNCYAVYSLNLIYEFTPLFSTKMICAGLPRKAFPGKYAKVDTGHQCFSVAAQATPQDSRRARPRAILEWKNLIEQLNLLSQHAPICAITCQHCATLQFVSWAETDSLCGRVMMAWIWHVWINAMVIVSMAQAPPKAGAKELLYSLESTV